MSINGKGAVGGHMQLHRAVYACVVLVSAAVLDKALVVATEYRPLNDCLVRFGMGFAQI